MFPLELTVADPVEYVDVVFNGDALYHAPLDEYAKQGGKIPRLEVDRSGWLVVRVSRVVKRLIAWPRQLRFMFSSMVESDIEGRLPNVFGLAGEFLR